MVRSFFLKLCLCGVFTSVGLYAMQPDVNREQAMLFDQIQPLLVSKQFDQARDVVLQSPYAEIFADGFLQIIDDAAAQAGVDLPEIAPVVVGPSEPLVAHDLFERKRDEIIAALDRDAVLAVLADFLFAPAGEEVQLSPVQMRRLFEVIAQAIEREVGDALHTGDVQQVQGLIDGLNMLSESAKDRDAVIAERMMRLAQDYAYQLIEHQARLRVQTDQRLIQELEQLRGRVRASDQLISRSEFTTLRDAIQAAQAVLSEARYQELQQAVDQATDEALQLNATRHAAQLDELVQRAFELHKTNDPQAPQALQRVIDVTPKDNPVHQRMVRLLRFGQFHQTS